MMRDKDGLTNPNYTVQAAVNADSGLVVATAVSDNPWDGGVLVEMVQSVEKNTGMKVAEVSADSAYNDGPALAAMEAKSITTFLPTRERPDRSPKNALRRSPRRATEKSSKTHRSNRSRSPRTNRLSREAFRFDAERNVYDSWGRRAKEDASRQEGALHDDADAVRGGYRRTAPCVL